MRVRPDNLTVTVSREMAQFEQEASGAAPECPHDAGKDIAPQGEASYQSLRDARAAVLQHISDAIEDPEMAACHEDSIWGALLGCVGEGPYLPRAVLGEYLRLADELLRDFELEQLPPQLCAAFLG